MATANPTDRLTVRLPVTQLDQVDALVARGLYKNRQDVLEDAIRQFIIKQGVA